MKVSDSGSFTSAQISEFELRVLRARVRWVDVADLEFVSDLRFPAQKACHGFNQFLSRLYPDCRCDFALGILVG